MAEFNPWTCSKCEKEVKVTKFKRNGAPKMPFRWVITDDGIVCKECRAEDALPRKIYKYEVLDKNSARISDADLAIINDQLHKVYLYRRDLVTLDRTRIFAIRDARLKLFPDYADLEKSLHDLNEKIEGQRKEINRIKSANRNNKVPQVNKEAIAAAKKKRKPLAERLKAYRKALWENLDFKAAVQEIEKKYTDDCKKARNKHSNPVDENDVRVVGLYSGSYSAAETAHKSSISKLRKTGKLPYTKKWEEVADEGLLACVIQGRRLFWPLTNQQDTRLRIEPLEISGVSKSGFRYGGSKKCKRFTVTLRLASQVNDDPIFVRLPIQMERPLPEGCEIKRVYLTCERVGLRIRRYVCFTVTAPEFQRNWERATSGSVGINLGWRLVPEGLRVAYYVGSDGERDQLVLPLEAAEAFTGLKSFGRRERKKKRTKCRATIAADEKTVHLQSIRSRAFDCMKEDLTGYLGNLPETPKWISDHPVYQHLAKIKSHKRVGDFICLLAKRAEELPNILPPNLVEWVQKEVHLYTWECDARKKWQIWRQHFYRQFWVMIGRRYKTVYIEDTKVAEMRRNPLPEDEKNVFAIKHRNRASIGLLRSLGIAALGEDVVIRPAANITTHCHACGHKCEWDHTILEHTCENCGETWDQDYNAAENNLHPRITEPQEVSAD